MKVKLGRYSLLLAFVFILMPFFVHAKEGISYNEVIKAIDEKRLYENKEWLYLLHYEGKQSVIDKKSPFFLSYKGYKNPKQEMYASIEKFFDEKDMGNNHAICMFPARFEYVLNNTEFLAKHFPQPKCEGYEEFKQKAPMDKVSIIYASENNSIPSSIMGHIFVKISGNVDGKNKEHAFSYFATDFDEKSPKVYLDVIFSSIDGIYALSPYSTKLNNYLFFEQRVIWEVELKLTKEQKSYLHKHMWELKEKNVKYSFIFHNCGTASINLFKIVYGDLNIYKIFETPIDYIKKFEKDSNIEDISLIPSPEYNLKMIRDNYNLIDIYKVRTKKENLTDKQKYLANLLHNYHESMGMIQNDKYKGLNETDIGIKRETKNILDAKPSSRIYVGYKNYNKDSLEIEFMPLYQNFYDISKAHFDDFETKVAAVNLIYDDKVYVNKIDLFSTKSYIDASMSWGMYSKYISLSLENALGEDGFNLKPVAESGFGYTFDLFNHRVKPYVLPKVGYRYDSFNNFYFIPEVGVILKLIDDVKIVTAYEKYFNSKGNNRGFDERYTVNVAYQLIKNTMINAKYIKYAGTETKDDEELSIGIGINF